MVKKLLCALTLACLLRFTASAADDFSTLQSSYAPLGQLIITQFLSAPFPHPARAAGHQYHDEFLSAPEHYSDSTVAIFIPKNFHPAGPLDFVVHFHGWHHTVAGALPEYHLIEQFAGANKNAILIVPQGPYNAPDSFGGKLEDTNGFEVFMNEALKKIAAAGAVPGTNPAIGDIILSGHSGGYEVMAAIVNHGGLSDHIREVWLFDALYAGTENFVTWQKSRNGRFIDIYTDHGGTENQVTNLMVSLKTDGVSFFDGEETNAVPDNLSTNKIVILHSDLVHNDVVSKRQQFEQFLKTCCLPNS